MFLHEKRGIGRGVLRGNSAAAGGEAAAAAMPRRKQQAPRRSAGNTLRLPRWGAAGTAGEGLTRREASPRGERFLQPCRRFKTPRVAASGGLGFGAEGGNRRGGGEQHLGGEETGAVVCTSLYAGAGGIGVVLRCVTPSLTASILSAVANTFKTRNFILLRSCNLRMRVRVCVCAVPRAAPGRGGSSAVPGQGWSALKVCQTVSRLNLTLAKQKSTKWDTTRHLASAFHWKTAAFNVTLKRLFSLLFITSKDVF